MQPDVLEKGKDHAMATRGFEQRIVKTRPRVYRLALRMLGNRSDAEDATQEALVRAWSGLDGYDPARSLYDPIRSFDAWVLRIARNVCISRIHRSRRTTEMSLDILLTTERDGAAFGLELADLSYDPQRLLLDKEIDEGLQQGIRSLPATSRRCFLLLAQEHSYQEIAARLDCPLGTVRSRLNRARAHLSHIIAR
jgi:RNA polymerase sigma-70 factor (ECF subfamily)